ARASFGVSISGSEDASVTARYSQGSGGWGGFQRRAIPRQNVTLLVRHADNCLPVTILGAQCPIGISGRKGRASDSLSPTTRRAQREAPGDGCPCAAVRRDRGGRIPAA